MRNITSDYLATVQGKYASYCFHVYNSTYVLNEKATEKDIKWYPSKFHKFLCNTVQEFIEKKNNKAFDILILSTPPQHGKSKTVTECLPSWYLGRNPDKTVIEVSYGDDLAERFGKSNLEKVKEFGELFGIELDPRKQTSKDFMLKSGGRMISKGFGSGITGNSGHLIIIDDPIKNRQEAESETKRNSIWNEFNDTILSRSQAGTKIILIMTRWHEDDLAGKILQTMPDITTYINLECECQTENDPLGRDVGEALCPEIGKGQEWLEEFKRSFTSDEGTRTWEALYQGHPSNREGNLLKREWWNFYDYEDFRNGELKLNRIVISVDAAFKDTAKNDFVAIQVWGKSGANCYLLESINEHLNFPQTMRKIRVLSMRYEKYKAIYIEDKANGSAIIQSLRDEIGGIIPVEPRGGKVSRVEAISERVEAGNFYLPRDKDFTWEFVDQCAVFPNGRHDDIVDAFSQCAIRLVRARTIERFVRRVHKSDWEETPKKSYSESIGNKESLNVF